MRILLITIFFVLTSGDSTTLRVIVSFLVLISIGLFNLNKSNLFMKFFVFIHEIVKLILVCLVFLLFICEVLNILRHFQVPGFFRVNGFFIILLDGNVICQRSRQSRIYLVSIFSSFDLTSCNFYFTNS